MSKFRLSSASGGGFITKSYFSNHESKIGPHYHGIVANGYEQETFSCRTSKPDQTLHVLHSRVIADIYISISMETFEHRKYKIRGDDGND